MSEDKATSSPGERVQEFGKAFKDLCREYDIQSIIMAATTDSADIVLTVAEGDDRHLDELLLTIGKGLKEKHKSHIRNLEAARATLPRGMLPRGTLH